MDSPNCLRGRAAYYHAKFPGLTPGKRIGICEDGRSMTKETAEDLGLAWREVRVV